MVRLGALLLAAMSAGCAARERAALVAQPSALAQHAPEATAPPPPVKVPVQTIEQLDPQLNAALAALLAHPSAESYRHVAAQYARLRIFDVADKYLSTAIDADRHNASLYDARARVRRDAGLPAFGLGDAYRAWHFAPTAEAATTLGTLFEGLGQLEYAREWYEKARSMQPDAWYVRNNLCHLDTVQARASAVDRCADALIAAPGSAVAQNNLALAFAVSGDLEHAREHFAAAGGETVAAYNMGLVYMATQQFGAAADEFLAVWQAAPTAEAADRWARALALQRHSRQ